MSKKNLIQKFLCLFPVYRKLSQIAASLPVDKQELLSSIGKLDTANQKLQEDVSLQFRQLAKKIESLNNVLAMHNTENNQRIDMQTEKLGDLIAMHNTENNQRIDMQTEKLGDLIAMHNTGNNQRINMQTEELKTLLAENNANISASLHALTNDISGLKIPLLQNDTLVRWQILDAIDDLLYPPHTPATCPVCGNSAPKSTLAVKTADCIYNGGRLDRFECPRCGAIFGPLKMLVMNQAQLATEYRQCYSVFSESSDTEELERSAFFDLSPDFDGVYLNYGAGAWNKTSEHLRSQGYKVYDYEPYAPATDSPWLLRSQEELRQLKFDGIFSNDLIEHLRNPVEALRSMADLLKQGGCMVHGSGCYEYAFEYTRFHLTFFTGKSLDFLGRTLNMDIELGERTAPVSPFRKCKFTPKA